MKHIIIFFFILFSLPLLSIALAQDNNGGIIQGQVKDAETLELLPGVSVAVLESTNGAKTDLEGRFTIRNLLPGTYRLQASAIGYSPFIKTDLVVAPGKQTEVIFQLKSTPLELSEIVVKPMYFEENKSVPVSSQSLSNEEIRRAPGGNEDVVRAIAVLPGVVQTSAGRNDLIVRGGAPSENLYIVDGHEIGNINHFGTQGATGGPLSFVNLDFVRDVTFSTGGFGVPYGDRLSSVTDLQLEEGRSDRIGGKATLAASQFGMNLEGPLAKNSTFIFSARRSYLDFVFKAAGFGFIPEYWDFLGKTVTHIDNHNQLSFVNLVALDQVKFLNNTPDQRFNNSQVLGSSQNQVFSGLTWQHLFSGGVWKNSLTQTYVDYDFLQSDSLLRPLFQSKSKETETGLSSDVVIRTSPQTDVSFGIQGRRIGLDGNLRLPPYQSSFGDSLSIPDVRWNGSACKAATYFQFTHSMMKRMTTTFGVRGDYFDRIQDKFVFSPRAAVLLALSEVTTFSVSGGVYHQSPSYIWLVTNPTNDALHFIRTDQAVVGIEHRIRPDTRIRLEGYVKYYREYPASLDRTYLVLANTGAGFGGSGDGFSEFGLDRMSSSGKGFTRGIELLVQKRLSEIRCYGIASLTFNKSEFQAIDGVKRIGQYDQRFIMNLSGGYQPNEQWEFGAKFRYGTGTPYTPIDNRGMQSLSQYNSQRLPDFHTLDIRVDRRWNKRGWTLDTYVDLQNVYNHKNVSGFRWNARKQIVETNKDIGLLPSIGVSSEF